MKATIGITVATRDLMTQLRDSGEITGGPPAFAKKERSTFLNGLEVAIQSARRRSDGTAGSNDESS